MTGSAQWDTTPLGLNYVTMNLKLATPAANLVAKTNALVYFQIEKPVFPAAARLLQAATNTTNTTAAANTTTVAATGTGDFEGHALVFLAPDATFNATSNATNAAAIAANYNMYSKTSCSVGAQNTVFYDKFCGATVTATAAASAW